MRYPHRKYMVKASTCLTFMGIVLGMIILAFYIVCTEPNLSILDTTVSDNIQNETDEDEDEETKTVIYDEYGNFLGYEDEEDNRYGWGYQE